MSPSRSQRSRMSFAASTKKGCCSRRQGFLKALFFSLHFSPSGLTLVLSLFAYSSTHGIGRGHEIRQSGTDLLPTACFEAAVWIDPDLLRRQDAQDVAQDGLELGCARDTRGVNIIDTRANLVGIVISDEGV